MDSVKKYLQKHPFLVENMSENSEPIIVTRTYLFNYTFVRIKLNTLTAVVCINVYKVSRGNVYNAIKPKVCVD